MAMGNGSQAVGGNGQTMFGGVGEYAYSWWAYGIRDQKQIIRFQTSRYALQFDVPGFKLTHLLPITAPAPEAAVLMQNDDNLFRRQTASLTCVVHSGFKTYRAVGASSNIDDCNVIESGKYFQRREITKIKWDNGCPAVDSSLEIAGWPDRLTLLLRVTPSETISGADLEMRLSAPPAFVVNQSPTYARKYENNDHNQWSVLLPVGEWKAGEERTLALVLSRRSSSEQGRLMVKAEQVAPIAASIPVSYDTAMGWYEIALRNDLTGEAPYNDRIERVKITLENQSNRPQVAHLNFAKGLPRDGGVFGITGLSAMIRDMDGNPTGIPVQISKNWHRKPGRYNGPWYRGLTMITVSPRQKIELEYTSVNALWGGVPAASHSQLCLVGWGSNQLWEQAAIGSWGESLCFEPDMAQASAAVLDSRPLMVWGTSKQPKTKWTWTCNVGGADFLVYYDMLNRRQFATRVKTLHRRTCPVLTETVYAGETRDGKIRVRYSTSLYRTDDITRGIYRFRYDIRKPAPFLRLALFECGSQNYSYAGERKFAFGNEHGLVREWNTTWGGNEYKGIPFPVTGKTPWFSMHEAVSKVTSTEAWADRGIVIRKWEAKLGGKMVGPWAAELGVDSGHGGRSSVIDILPPPGVRILKAGDYVECEIEHIIMPQFAEDYYGPNENLKKALLRDQDTWKMIQREATGNDLDVKVTLGHLVRTRPTTIQAVGNRAMFTITGGLGYVPITVTGLKDYRKPALEINENGQWRKIDQSVFSNDYWQADYNTESGTWEITFSIPMDLPDDARVTRSFRFGLGF